MKKNKIKKYLSISLILAFILPAFTARADLVDDLIKEQKLDPKNNPKDQCQLMNALQREISENGIKIGKKTPVCIKNEVCQLFVPYYHFDKNPKLEGLEGAGEEIIIYRPSSNQIIGKANNIEVDSDNFYDPSIAEFKEYIKKYYNFYAQDFRKDKRFKRFDAEKYNQSKFNYKFELIVTHSKTKPHQGIAYFKVDGCYIRESNLLKEYLQRNSTQNSN